VADVHALLELRHVRLLRRRAPRVAALRRLFHRAEASPAEAGVNSRPTQAQRVLAILRDVRWHSTLEFVEAGVLRASARVFELRRAGYAIEVRRRGSIYEYRLALAPPASLPSQANGLTMRVGGRPKPSAGGSQARRTALTRSPAAGRARVEPNRPRNAGPCVVCELVDGEAALIGGQWWCPRHAELAA
jgi:hypothetical protein